MLEVLELHKRYGEKEALRGVSLTVRPGEMFGFVGANGGTMSAYSVGIYSTTPVEWRTDRSEELNAEVAALPTVPITERPEGRGTIETYSVRYDVPVRTGIIVGRLDADNSRFLAITTDDDLLTLMTEGDPLGAAITVRPEEKVNRAGLA